MDKKLQLEKILLSDDVENELLSHVQELVNIIPEVADMIGFEQNNPYHKYDVWMHTVKAVANTPNDLITRLAMLLHDIGKPCCYTQDEKGIGHFYKHAHYSGKIASETLTKLGYDDSTITNILQLIMYHDAHINANYKAVKRWLNKLDKNLLVKLIHIKNADALAQSGLQLEERLENNKQLIELINETTDEKTT